MKSSDQSFLGVTFGLSSFCVCLSQMYYRHGSKPANFNEQTPICLYYFIVLAFLFYFQEFRSCPFTVTISVMCTRKISGFEDFLCFLLCVNAHETENWSYAEGSVHLFHVGVDIWCNSSWKWTSEVRIMQFSSPLLYLLQLQTAEYILKVSIKGQSCSFALGSLHQHIKKKPFRCSDFTVPRWAAPSLVRPVPRPRACGIPDPASAAGTRFSACPCQRPRAGGDGGGERPRGFKDVIK